MELLWLIAESPVVIIAAYPKHGSQLFTNSRRDDVKQPRNWSQCRQCQEMCSMSRVYHHVHNHRKYPSSAVLRNNMLCKQKNIRSSHSTAARIRHCSWKGVRGANEAERPCDSSSCKSWSVLLRQTLSSNPQKAAWSRATRQSSAARQEFRSLCSCYP